MSARRTLGVLFEHPEWQKPLFAALESCGVEFEAIDLTRLAFDAERAPAHALYFNQASPSAYLRGQARAVPLALGLMRSLELRGAQVLNGSQVFALELSKSAQAALLRSLGIATPRTITFNDVAALEAWQGRIDFPALLKPDQGGSGARIYKLDSLAELRALLERDPGLWLPDNLLNLQELIAHDPEPGIVRMEFLGGELLYAMRVRTHGRFNLCPSPVCNPEDGGEGACEVPALAPGPPVEFSPYHEVPAEAVKEGLRIVEAVGLAVGGIEYLEGDDGRRYFYDINANSNLRPSIAQAFGFNPFDRVAAFLKSTLARS